MTIIKSTILVVSLFFNVLAFCQIQVGAGLNLGPSNIGVELQGYSLERLKVFTGANLRKYNSFSARIGVGLSILPLSEKHNFWVNSNVEYNFSSSPTIEKNEILYTYQVNKLNYWNIVGAYSFRIDNNLEKESFILLEVKLISKQLINQLDVRPTEGSSVVDESLESRLRQYYYSGLHFAVGVKFVW